MTRANAASEMPVPEVMTFLAMTFLFPAAIMTIVMGNFMMGEEGQTVWRIYSSPISAKNLVKSKYSFMLFFPLIILPVTGTIGYVLFQPSLRAVMALTLEAVFLVFALGALSLSNGIKGADFAEVPRPRMIRTEWGLINMLTCLAAALAVLAPLLLYAIPTFIGVSLGPFIDFYLAVIISGIIAAVLTVIFYTMAVGNAKELLAKAEA
jgi:hydrogenase-4 membrane subunit HyfE